jgi:hypothetical protein
MPIIVNANVFIVLPAAVNAAEAGKLAATGRSVMIILRSIAVIAEPVIPVRRIRDVAARLAAIRPIVKAAKAANARFVATILI